MGESINIVIVEMHRLKNMIEAYSQWFQRNVEMYRKQGSAG
jgi:RecB family endonuclease NucS